MRFDELKEKALSLPYAPGVYIMRDDLNKVIYVGKAKKLKNRVSQYFQDTANHTPKTRLMVSKIDHFDTIVAASEFEALVLECSLIKRYLPKYNILLKDDKGYPYLRLDLREEYPRLTMVSHIEEDGARYYGPYGGRSATQGIIDAIREIMKLPGCSKVFPRDIGKERPCLNYHMNQCAGWCQPSKTAREYRQIMEQVRQLLEGNYKAVAAQIRQQMLSCADRMEFELAAILRDRLRAVEALGQKQLVTAGTLADTDVIGYAQTAAKACFAVLHFSGGNLLDKDYEILPTPDDPEAAVSSLMKQYYLSRGFAPKFLLLPFEVEDADLFTELLEQQYGRRPHLKIPQRGDNVRLVELAEKNATEEAERATGKEERVSATLQMLGKMLKIAPPRRIESYDNSHISGTDLVAGMVVFENGRPLKSAYRRFKLRDMIDQDDYASMRQILTRRLTNYLNQDPGFEVKPDLLLIDGGQSHAQVVREVLQALNLTDIPMVGMVKDDRHRTRALITADGEEISIIQNQAVFSFIGTVQEEVHRFAITYHRSLRSKRLRYSELDSIPGIGPKRKQQLLKTFKSLSGIGEATLPELERQLPKDAAYAVYQHFHTGTNQEEDNICG